MMRILGAIGLAAILLFGWVTAAQAEGHDGIPSRREGTTRVYKQPPPEKGMRAIVVTPLFAVWG